MGRDHEPCQRVVPVAEANRDYGKLVEKGLPPKRLMQPMPAARFERFLCVVSFYDFL